MRLYRKPNRAEKGLALVMLVMAVLCVPLLFWLGPEFLMLQSIFLICFFLISGKQPVSGRACKTAQAATER